VERMSAALPVAIPIVYFHFCPAPGKNFLLFRPSQVFVYGK
jgi:hypothetical protein